jgi:hypothetical protein
VPVDRSVVLTERLFCSQMLRIFDRGNLTRPLSINRAARKHSGSLVLQDGVTATVQSMDYTTVSGVWKAEAVKMGCYQTLQSNLKEAMVLLALPDELKTAVVLASSHDLRLDESEP